MNKDEPKNEAMNHTPPQSEMPEPSEQKKNVPAAERASINWSAVPEKYL